MSTSFFYLLHLYLIQGPACDLCDAKVDRGAPQVCRVQETESHGGQCRSQVESTKENE